MNERLDLKIVRNIGTDFLDLSQRKLSRRHHALCPLLIPEPVGAVIGVVCLRTDMALDLGTDFLSNHIDPRIGNDQRIRLYLPKLGEILSHTENWARVTYYRGREALRKELEKDNEK